jgi:hypothetical protein
MLPIASSNFRWVAIDPPSLNPLQDLLYFVGDPRPWGKAMRRREFIALLGGAAVA